MGCVAYFKNLYQMCVSILVGMQVTIGYFLHPKKTCVTLQYPHVCEPLPERHRGIHYLETEKCIMCQLCAKTCPVNCIRIESTRDGELLYGYKSKNGHLSRFTVDYGRCLFCNLCTEVCTPKCLHMQPVAERPYKDEFDFSATTRLGVLKNLLSDKRYTAEDHHRVKVCRVESKKLAEVKKQKTQEA
jgi:formate hydrogenlyase subunit 6/NADH:ubiquinone oxidoreductase subunit I